MKLFFQSIILILLLCAQPCAAQIQYNVTQYDMEDGLPQQTVSDILRDHKGCMWFGTWNGICRFDGYTFKAYSRLSHDSDKISSSRIRDIKEDKSGFLWLVNDDKKVYRFNPATENISPFTGLTDMVQSVMPQPNGEVWILEREGKLLRINKNTKENIYYQQVLPQHSIDENIVLIHTNGKDTWIVANNGFFLFQAKQNKVKKIAMSCQAQFYCAQFVGKTLYMGSRQGLLCIYDTDKGEFQYLQLEKAGDITQIVALPNEKVAAITRNGGLFIVDKSLQSKHYALTGNEISSIMLAGTYAWICYTNSTSVTRLNIADGTSKNYTIAGQKNAQTQRTLTTDSSGNLWIFSIDEVLNYYNPQTDEFLPLYIPHSDDASSYIKPGLLYNDQRGNFWIGEAKRGLVKLTIKKSMFTLSTPPDLTSSNELRSIMQDSQGRFWCGSVANGIQIYDKDKHFAGYLNENGKISGRKENLGAAYSIVEDNDRHIWIATKDRGLMELTSTDASGQSYHIQYYTKVSKDVSSISYDVVYSVCKDKNGRIWVGTFGGGLNYIERDADGKVHFVNHRNKLVGYPMKTNSKVRDIFADKQGNIWASTTGGVLQCSWKNNALTFNRIDHKKNEKQDSGSDNVYMVHETQNGDYFFATFGGGLTQMKGFGSQKTEFNHYSSEEGFANIPLTLAEDHSGMLWVSSEEGLFKFDPSKNTFEKFDNRFLPSQTIFTESNTICDSTGNMIFCTDKGLLSFNPAELKNDTYKSSLVLTDLVTKQKDKKFSHIDLNEQHKFTFKHSENSFTFGFVTLDMRFPDKIEYAYRLHGFDQWNYVGNNRKAVYTNVPKGEYTLEIKSTNSDGAWVNHKQVPVKVLPSFWESTYGILLYILFFLLLVGITSYILLIIYKLRNRVAIEKKILDVKTDFFTDIIHELRTPFTLIIAPLDHLLSQKDLSTAARQDLEMMKRNTNHTVKLINQVLDLQKIQSDRMKLKVQQLDLVPFINHLIESFQPIAAQRDSELLLQTKSDNRMIWADADKLDSILTNLITNAFKYSPKGTTIKVILNETDQDIIIRVADQGYGISPERQQNIFNRFENYLRADIFKQQSTGIGLSLVKQLVELHDGTISLSSKVDEGSTFTITLPKGKEHFNSDTEFILSDFTEEKTVEQDTPFTQNDDDAEELDKENLSETILVVEDNDELRSFLHTILSDSFRTITAENGRFGLEKAIKYQPNMIISDVVMPVMDGISMVKKLQANVQTCHIPIVLLSSQTSVESQNEGLDLGVDDYITKPFSASYLKARINNIIRQRKKWQALYYSQLLQQPNEENIASSDKMHEDLSHLSKVDQELIDKVLLYIKNNMDDTELSVEKISSHIGISRSLLFKKLKAVMDISPVELIRNVRVKRAAELIDEGSYNFTQIAYTTGFSDSQYFSKCFKAIYGMTPTEYKNSSEKKGQ